MEFEFGGFCSGLFVSFDGKSSKTATDPAVFPYDSIICTGMTVQDEESLERPQATQWDHPFQHSQITI